VIKGLLVAFCCKKLSISVGGDAKVAKIVQCGLPILFHHFTKSISFLALEVWLRSVHFGGLREFTPQLQVLISKLNT